MNSIANINGTVTSVGALSVSGGQVGFNSNAFSVPTINLSGGALAGSAQITSTGLISWTGGSMSGLGTTNADGGLLLNSTTTLLLSQRTLNNAAGQTATFQGTGDLYFFTGAVFNNSGTFLAENDRSFFNGGGGGVFNNTGTFTRDTSGGTFTVQSGVTFNNSGSVNVNSGTLTVLNGYTQTAGTTRVNGGTLSALGAINIQGGLLTGFGTISAPIQNNAMLQPALAAGGLNVSGNVSLLSSSQLTFQLGGLTQGSQYGYLNVNGTVALGGQLVVSFVNGFQPTNNNNFTVLNSTGLSGAFTNVPPGTRVTTTDGFGSFLVTYPSNNQLLLSDYQPSEFAATHPPNRTTTSSSVSADRVTSDEPRTLNKPGLAFHQRPTTPARPGVVVQNTDQLLALMEGNNVTTNAQGRVIVHPLPAKPTGKAHDFIPPTPKDLPAPPPRPAVGRPRPAFSGREN